LSPEVLYAQSVCADLVVCLIKKGLAIRPALSKSK
jgi:hypothetical protein